MLLFCYCQPRKESKYFNPDLAVFAIQIIAMKVTWKAKIQLYCGAAWGGCMLIRICLPSGEQSIFFVMIRSSESLHSIENWTRLQHWNDHRPGNMCLQAIMLSPPPDYWFSGSVRLDILWQAPFNLFVCTGDTHCCNAWWHMFLCNQTMKTAVLLKDFLSVGW